MRLKAYYDGSGKSNDPTCKFLTLAGFSATDDTWPRVNLGWNEILRDYGIEFFHFTDALGLQGSFGREKGWDHDRVDRLLMDLHTYLSTFRNYEDPAQTDLLGFSCTVNLEDYRSLPKSLGLKDQESLCVDWCTGLQFKRFPTPTHKYLEFYFDHGETFLHKINRMFTKPKSEQPHWVKCVSKIEKISMKDTPGIQMADFLAGAMTRAHKTSDDWWRVNFLLTAPVFEKYYDKTSLLEKAAKSRTSITC